MHGLETFLADLVLQTKNKMFQKPTEPKPTLFDEFRQNQCSGGVPVLRDGRFDRFFEKHPKKLF